MATDPSGWCPFAEKMPTQVGGYDDIPEDGMYCDGVMSHVAGGYMGGLIGMAQNPATPVSWHFSISRTGRVLQHRSIADPAYHAGIVNQPTWRLLKGRNPNRCTVGIEHEGFSIPASYADYVYDSAHPWPEALIEASIEVHQWVFDQVNRWTPGYLSPSEDTVITHSMTDQRTRSQDPGDLWLVTVRPRIIAALQGQPTPAPAPFLDDFQRGRVEMYEAWLRDAEAYAEHVKSRREAWGIPTGGS